MFEALAREIDEVEILARGDAIVEAVALRDRLSAKIAQAVGEFDDARLWDLDAATSMTAWLRDKAAMTNKEASHTTSVARRLASLPVTAAAWRSGELSSGQVDAVLAHVDAATLGLFSDHEAAVIPSLVGLSVTDTVRAMAAWKSHASAVCEDPDPPEAQRSLHVSKTLDGRYALDGDLDAEGGAILATALRLAGGDDVEGEPARTPAERRADALVDVCRFFLDHQQHHRGGRHRPHLNVVIDLDDLLAGRGGQVVDGGALERSSLEAMLCTVPCTGGDEGALGGARLRQLHPHHPGDLVERPGDPRRGVSVPGL